MSRLSEFLFEAGALKRTPRSGYQFLGRGHENVAEHSFGVVTIAYALGRLAGELGPGGERNLESAETSRTPGLTARPAEAVNMERLLLMALFHDLPEARTGDLNYVNKQFVTAHEQKAFEAATRDLPFTEELGGIRAEWREGLSLEARLAADADQLDMILELRRLSVHGWPPAGGWLKYAVRRLKTASGRKLCQQIMETSPDDWWFEDRDELWINPSGTFGQEDGSHAARRLAAEAEGICQAGDRGLAPDGSEPSPKGRRS